MNIFVIFSKYNNTHTGNRLFTLIKYMAFVATIITKVITGGTKVISATYVSGGAKVISATYVISTT